MIQYPTRQEIPSEVQIPEIRGRILIDGKILDQGFARKPVHSPCSIRQPDGSLQNPVIGETPDCNAEQFMDAVDAAVKAWDKGRGEWPTARMEERIAAVARLRQLIAEKRDLLAKLLMWEIAKTKADAYAEVDRTLVYIDDTVEAVKQLDRDCSRIQFAGGIMAQIRRMPLGVTLCMGPFNYPFNETFTTLIPALILGNCIVVKVPRFGQLFWDVLLEPFQHATPAGVVNVVNGLGRQIIEPAIRTGKIDVLAFIGSSPVANQIKLSHPQPHRFRSILGLGAKNPAIILKDAKLDNAVEECVRGTLSFNGQRCTALKMIYVHRDVAQIFVEKITTKVDSLKCGLPWEAGTSITPLPDPQKPKQLTDYVSDAVTHGARLANPRGGKIEGSLFAPAVLADVKMEAKIAQEEQFGPVVPILLYDRVQEIEELMVNSPYGMQASIFGEDPEIIGHLVDGLSNQVCRINLNTQCQRGPDVYPFTGRKGSAEGTLSVTDALRQFSIRAMVAAKQDADGKRVFKAILDQDHSHFLNTHIVL